MPAPALPDVRAFVLDATPDANLIVAVTEYRVDADNWLRAEVELDSGETAYVSADAIYAYNHTRTLAAVDAEIAHRRSQRNAAAAA